MKNWKISTQLNLGFLLVAILFLLLITITAWRAHAASEATGKMQRAAQLLVLANSWQATASISLQDQATLLFNVVGAFKIKQTPSSPVLSPH